MVVRLDDVASLPWSPSGQYCIVCSQCAGRASDPSASEQQCDIRAKAGGKPRVVCTLPGCPVCQRTEFWVWASGGFFLFLEIGGSSLQSPRFPPEAVSWEKCHSLELAHFNHGVATYK